MTTVKTNTVLVAQEETTLVSNAKDLVNEYRWLALLLEVRFKWHTQEQTEYKSIAEIEAPNLHLSNSLYATCLKQYKFSLEERVILLLALAPHVCPQLLDRFFLKNSTTGIRFTEFGGIQGKQHNGIILKLLCLSLLATI
jgi:hypothetical protein